MPAAKPSLVPKAMDIHTPATAPAVPTSKPVIVPSRPMASDPMLSEASAEKETPDVPGEIPGASPAVGRHSKTISPPTSPAADQATEAPTLNQTEVDDTSQDAATPMSTEKTLSNESGADEQTAADKAAAVAGEAAVPAAEETPPTPEIPRPPLTESALAEEEAIEDSDDTEIETAVQEKTAEQIRADQLEDLIAKGHYAVPLNRTGRRRAKTLLAFLFVILVTIVVVDLLLDMQVLTISGLPHTDLIAP